MRWKEKLGCDSIATEILGEVLREILDLGWPIPENLMKLSPGSLSYPLLSSNARCPYYSLSFTSFLYCTAVRK